MTHGQEQLIRLAQQTQQQTQQQIQQAEQRLLAELSRHSSAVYEAMRAEIRAAVEPFADLPGRMRRVEAAVFGPRRAADGRGGEATDRRGGLAQRPSRRLPGRSTRSRQAGNGPRCWASMR